MGSVMLSKGLVKSDPAGGASVPDVSAPPPDESAGGSVDDAVDEDDEAGVEDEPLDGVPVDALDAGVAPVPDA